jgi:hypothetical protein
MKGIKEKCRFFRKREFVIMKRVIFVLALCAFVMPSVVQAKSKASIMFKHPVIKAVKDQLKKDNTGPAGVKCNWINDDDIQWRCLGAIMPGEDPTKRTTCGFTLQVTCRPQFEGGQQLGGGVAVISGYTFSDIQNAGEVSLTRIEYMGIK